MWILRNYALPVTIVAVLFNNRSQLLSCYHLHLFTKMLVVLVLFMRAYCYQLFSGERWNKLPSCFIIYYNKNNDVCSGFFRRYLLNLCCNNLFKPVPFCRTSTIKLHLLTTWFFIALYFILICILITKQYFTKNNILVHWSLDNFSKGSKCKQYVHCNLHV